MQVIFPGIKNLDSVWDSEVNSKAHVHCVIIGFAKVSRKEKYIYDGGFLIIEDSDYKDFIEKDPDSVKFIKPLLGATEYINNKKRWCLWLGQHLMR